MKVVAKFGLIVRELSVENSEEIFKVLSEEFIDRRKHQSMIDKDERVIRGKIAYTFKHNHYVAIGLYKGQKLIGVALCNNKNDIPWIGYLTVTRKYRGTKGFLLLSYYITNILYKNKPVRLDGTNIYGFKNAIMKMPAAIGGYIIKQETAARLKRMVTGE